MDLPDGTRRVEMAKEQQSRDARQAELLTEARVAVFDTKKAELVAQRILAQHSTKVKVALSELVVQTAEDLRSGEIKPKDRALALAALKSVGNQLYGWDREPDIQRMEMARTSDHSQVKSYYQHWLEGTEPPPATGAVNLALIATSPAELEAMANQDSHYDVSAPEYNAQGMGPPVEEPEPPSATHGRPIPEKEAPRLLVKQPVQPRWKSDLQQAEKANRGNPPSETAPKAPQNALKQSVRQTSVQEPPPTPGSQAWHKLRLQELARLRAEWRR
jgi:hypothetical protein